MRAMILSTFGSPLQEVDLRIPTPNPEQLLIRVHARGFCRTDLSIAI